MRIEGIENSAGVDMAGVLCSDNRALAYAYVGAFCVLGRL